MTTPKLNIVALSTWGYSQMLNPSLFDNEVKKELINHTGYYITNFGRVFKGNKLIFINYNKYINKHFIQIQSVYKRHTYLLHRLVAKYFIENPKNYPDVLFINGNNEDCRVENLYWGIQQVNIPTWNPKTKQKGETCIFNDKLNENQVIEIYLANGTHSSIAKHYNISRTFVSMIKSGKRWAWLTKDINSKSIAI